MKTSLIMMISCIFSLLLASAAQASEFAGNTCNEEGANCQTQSEWMIGWCEAASAAGAVDQTVEECRQSVGADHHSYQVSAEDYKNAQGDSGQRSLERASDAEGSSGNSGDSGAARQSSGRSSGQGEQCQYYRVQRSDPSRLECVRPQPESVPPDSEGPAFDPFDNAPNPFTD